MVREWEARGRAVDFSFATCPPNPGSHLGTLLPSETPDPRQALSAFLKPGTPKELGFINNDLVLPLFGHMSNLRMVLWIPRGQRLGLIHLQILEKALQNVYIGFFVK